MLLLKGVTSMETFPQIVGYECHGEPQKMEGIAIALVW